MILLLGAGGFAKEVYSWGDFKDVTFFDDRPKVKQLLGKQVVSSMKGFSGFFPAVGSPSARISLVHRAEFCGLTCDVSLLHSHGTVSSHNTNIGVGTIVCPGARVSPDVTIGKYCILNLNCTVGHDSVIEDFVTISPGAFISGRCKIEEGAYIGTGACIREGVTIGSEAVVGMGAVVLSDIPARWTVVGNPAQRLIK